MKKIILLFLTLLSLPQMLFAQAADQVEMADKLRADGKIWVVVAVVAIVLAGIAINMFRVDSKVSKIEKELNIK
ncbi:CcmD family protein [Dyadobacter diqingensis]|uniref:CcmD family protein n=1 Tax=Dyadobacter diqingensis TaxID=2938121 RepID=UPI0020C1A848|nr:CcmD family protein [Dyadobacter diqingensis]